MFVRNKNTKVEGGIIQCLRSACKEDTRGGRNTKAQVRFARLKSPETGPKWSTMSDNSRCLAGTKAGRSDLASKQTFELILN
jgi:hypothetical protein